jgi:hypothetical protein
MRMKERELRREFFAAGAVQPIGARSLSELGLEETMAVKRLCRRSVIREASPGLFYWDEDVWQALRAMRLRMALLLIGTIILVGLMIAYGSVKLK